MPLIDRKREACPQPVLALGAGSERLALRLKCHFPPEASGFSAVRFAMPSKPAPVLPCSGAEMALEPFGSSFPASVLLCSGAEMACSVASEKRLPAGVQGLKGFVCQRFAGKVAWLAAWA
jgi:hypothetical protein